MTLRHPEQTAVGLMGSSIETKLSKDLSARTWPLGEKCWADSDAVDSSNLKAPSQTAEQLSETSVFDAFGLVVTSSQLLYSACDPVKAVATFDPMSQFGYFPL